MTDKLKLFKVRLASGAERYIVAPDLVAVAQLTFERPASGSISAGVDPVKGVEEDLDVDFVILREPQDGVTPPPAVIIEKLTVGAPCPQCGGPLHASLGQLMCSLGHQVGPVPEGTFHNHASSVDGRLTCKACQREAAESAKEKKFAEDVAKGACLHPGIFRGEVCQRCGQLAGFTPQDVAGA